MSYSERFVDTEPKRSEIDASGEDLVLEFSAPWCGYCKAAQPLIREVLEQTDLNHVKVEDGKGRPLGRSFGVTLWPTLVFIRDGEEQARVVRPKDTNEIREALARLGGY